MNLVNVRVGVASVAAAIVFLGCSSPLDVTLADFEGTVESVRMTEAGTDVLIRDIDPPPRPSPLGDADRGAELFLKKRVWVVRSSHVVVRQADGSLRRGGDADILTGDRVRVKTTGVEMRSAPPQYYAEWIEVTR